MQRFALLLSAACCHTAFGNPHNVVWNLPGAMRNSGLRLQGDIDTAKRNTQELAEQLKAKVAELDQLSAAVGRANAEKALADQKYQAAATAVRSQHVEVIQKIHGLVAEKTMLEEQAAKEAEVARKQAEAVAEQKAKQMSYIRQLGKEKAALSAQVAEVQGKIRGLSGKTRTVGALMKANMHMEEQIQGASDKEVQQQDLINQLNDELAALKLNFADQEKKTASLSTEYAMLQARNKELKDAVLKATEEKQAVEKALQSIPESA